ncbi:hypothetical protein [Streptomyces kanamyceticus]
MEMVTAAKHYREWSVEKPKHAEAPWDQALAAERTLRHHPCSI